MTKIRIGWFSSSEKYIFELDFYGIEIYFRVRFLYRYSHSDCDSDDDDTGRNLQIKKTLSSAKQGVAKSLRQETRATQLLFGKILTKR